MEEGKTENALEVRKEKIKKWLSKKYNLYFLGILILAFAIRLYYFSITLDQPVWWDEAEYMNMARAWAFNLDYNFLSVRPVLFSLITALFFKITYSEFLPRLFILILSMASVAGMYYLGKEIYNKKIGLLSAFFMSIFYLNLFYTSRLLVGVPSLTFFIFSAIFFYKYFKTKSNKMLYLGSVLIAVGTLFRITTATFLFVIAIYLLVTERLNFLKKKELWISGLIFILILSPYLIWGYLQFNGFVITQAGAWNAPKDHYFSNAFCNIKSYFSMLLSIFSWPLLLFFILGLFLMYELILGLDVLIKGGDFKLNKYLFLFLLFLLPLITVSFSLANCYHEDRYILNSAPAIFIISSAFILKAFNLIKEKKKVLAILLLIFFLGFMAYLQLQHADNLIKFKKESFMEMKTSGMWMKENSELGDIILTSSEPMTGYYSEREVIGFPESEEEFALFLEENKNIKYYMVSSIQRSPDWAYSYPQENNLTIAQVYFSDETQTQPLIIIYKLEKQSLEIADTIE